MSDPRHIKRINVVQNLFAGSFRDTNENLPHPGDEMTRDILLHVDSIDELIQRHAPKYPLDRIAKTDLAVLRLAVYELKINVQQPQKVVIDEAVKLAKEFGGDRSFAFVNAVLGAIAKSDQP